MNDLMDRHRRYAIVCRESALTCTIGVGATYRRYVHFGENPRNTRPLAVSSFCAHVVKIVGASTEEQMIGANTERSVAVVADVHPLWDGSKMHPPGLTMCPFKAEDAIPSDRPVACPEPTAVRLLHLLPEAIG